MIWPETWSEYYHEALSKMLKIEKKLDGKRDKPLIKRIEKGLKYLALRKARHVRLYP